MQYFSIYDMLLDKAILNNHNENEMLNSLKKSGVSRGELQQLKVSAYYPTNSLVLEGVLNYLQIDELMLNLSLGRIPSEYRGAYYSQISKIAEILTDASKSDVPPVKPLSVSYASPHGTLYHGDCRDVLRSVEDNSVDIIFADPPFNLGKEYDEGISDQSSITAYLNWSFEWIDECVRILKEGGYLFIYNLPKWCTYIAGYLNQHLTYWDWIALDMKYRLPISGRLYPAHYALIAYVKGNKPNTFNNQRVPLQTCRHCGGEIKDYGGYKGKMNPKGVNLSDVWADIYPVRHKTTKNRKYNELPVKLLDRIIMMASNEGDTILDPFGGSGTTYAVAQLRGRKWIGCELGDCTVIASRLTNPRNDSRQLDKIDEQKDVLFTAETVKTRTKNGFWLPEDVCDSCSSSQTSLLI